MTVGEKIPDCKYWRFQGDHNMIGCQITGALCDEDCDIEKVDPTGNLRKKIDEEKASEEALHSGGCQGRYT